MNITEVLARGVQDMLPTALCWTVLPLIPFIVIEQLRPVGKRPQWRDYASNVLINLSTTILLYPVGATAGLCSIKLRPFLPWKPLAFTFERLGHIPWVGPGAEFLAMIFVPIFLHDCWFYWAHRLEHKVSFLWEFHKLHHSDENMNCSTFARDHFLQATWRAFFPVFSLGLLLDLTLKDAGKTAFASSLFVVLWTMFYHSAIRVRLSWLDPLLVTPRLHRLHHAVDTEQAPGNFADFLPIFDIVFGTYRRPGQDESPATGLAHFSPPRSLWASQVGPVLRVGKLLFCRRRSGQIAEPSC